MPSEGSPRIILRVPEPWYSKMLQAIRSNNEHVRVEEWTLSSWVLDAVKDKVAHQERARVQREKKKANTRARKLAELLGRQRIHDSTEG